MEPINLKKEIPGVLEAIVSELTALLEDAGFGVLTRIDLHAKVKAALGKTMAPAVILGVCDPALAYEAYTTNTDVASLLPCNAVVRDVGAGVVSVEIASPATLMRVVGDPRLDALARAAEARLRRALDKLHPALAV
jgi:uncharacterized protein (DUF302 family)